jgi:hypothetical protein
MDSAKARAARMALACERYLVGSWYRRNAQSGAASSTSTAQ